MFSTNIITQCFKEVYNFMSGRIHCCAGPHAARGLDSPDIGPPLDDNRSKRFFLYIQMNPHKLRTFIRSQKVPKIFFFFLNSTLVYFLQSNLITFAFFSLFRVKWIFFFFFFFFFFYFIPRRKSGCPRATMVKPRVGPSLDLYLASFVNRRLPRVILGQGRWRGARGVLGANANISTGNKMNYITTFKSITLLTDCSGCHFI